MFFDICQGILLPLVGTVCGSACVFFMSRAVKQKVQNAMLGFAGGVMVAASVWSLLIPSVESSSALGKLSFFPSLIGFWLGIMFLVFIDAAVSKMILRENTYFRGEGKQTFMLVFAVALHNLPEGMAVGAVLANIISGESGDSFSEAIVLAAGIAVQNFPEGAVISLPLKANGTGTLKSFLCGALSGIVEPIGAVVTIALAGLMVPILPYLLGFAAGAMVYVVVEELIPSVSDGEKSGLPSIWFCIGFSVMMVLDVALG